MNIFNQPSYEQMSEQISVLREIAGKMGIVGTIASWDDVQQIVRRGQADKYFSVGDQLMSTYNGIPTIWNVIGINHDTPTNESMTHSMTIQTKDCLQNAQFDAPEPTNPDSNRQEYGNNRYIHSGIRQWLNSDAAAFTWVSQHEYDAASSLTGPGFLKLLDPELAAVIGAVDKQVARNTITDGGGQDLFNDKVFLLSRVETGYETGGVTTGEVVYPYYEGLSEAGKIKLLSNTPRDWWLRSPFVGNSTITRHVTTSGALNTRGASYALGLSPACVII